MNINIVNTLIWPFILVHCIIPAFDYGNAITARSTPFVKVGQTLLVTVDIYKLFVDKISKLCFVI
jgi:hypothetical protein